MLRLASFFYGIQNQKDPKPFVICGMFHGKVSFLMDSTSKRPKAIFVGSKKGRGGVGGSGSDSGGRLFGVPQGRLKPSGWFVQKADPAPFSRVPLSDIPMVPSSGAAACGPMKRCRSGHGASKKVRRVAFVIIINFYCDLLLLTFIVT